MKLCIILDCENPVEGRTDKCATHNHEQRKAERQARKVQIVHQPKKVSAKQAKNLVDYGVLRRIYLQEHPVCESGLPGDICGCLSVEVHHRAKRGKNLLDASTFMAVCRSCHDYIEFTMSAEERREKGYLITKNETV
jgi:hypothetical protein